VVDKEDVIYYILKFTVGKKVRDEHDEDPAYEERRY
jgi:hypothetical protein